MKICIGRSSVKIQGYTRLTNKTNGFCDTILGCSRQLGRWESIASIANGMFSNAIVWPCNQFFNAMRDTKNKPIPQKQSQEKPSNYSPKEGKLFITPGNKSYKQNKIFA